jgi:hypothetical protein
MLAVVAALAGFAALRRPGALGAAAGGGTKLALKVLACLPLALLLAQFVALLLPRALVVQAIGGGTGMLGVLIAGLFGSAVPGGPMVSFPLALSLAGAGAGKAQLIAFLTGWSVVAVHRLLAYELPLMGAPFAMLRLSSVLVLPYLAGGVALIVT